jgi:hypothetical protein
MIMLEPCSPRRRVHFISFSPIDLAIPGLALGSAEGGIGALGGYCSDLPRVFQHPARGNFEIRNTNKHEKTEKQ